MQALQGELERRRRDAGRLFLDPEAAEQLRQPRQLAELPEEVGRGEQVRGLRLEPLREPRQDRLEVEAGQAAPEDLVVLPGGEWVIAGSYAGAGGINLIRVSDRMSIKAYPTPDAREAFDSKTYKSCPGVPDAATKAKAKA